MTQEQGPQFVSGRLKNNEPEQANMYEGEGLDPIDFSKLSKDTIINFHKEIDRRAKDNQPLGQRLTDFQNWLKTKEGQESMKFKG
jgi:hypothetical protein